MEPFLEVKFVFVDIIIFYHRSYKTN